MCLPALKFKKNLHLSLYTFGCTIYFKTILFCTVLRCTLVCWYNSTTVSTSLRAALLFSLNIFLWVTYSKESLIQKGLNRYKFASLICNCKEITASPNWKRLLFEPRLLMKWTRYWYLNCFLLKSPTNQIHRRRSNSSSGKWSEFCYHVFTRI